MMFPFGRKQGAERRRLIERLREDIVAAARQPGFYRDCGVADTFQGRFEMLALHGGLALRRLNAAPAPGPEIAQQLIDRLFAGLDADLRELGVGDLTVPKKMKKLAEAFLGRGLAYDTALRAPAADGKGSRLEGDTALETGEALEAVLERNVFDGEPAGDRAARARLARYVRAAEAALREASLEACLASPLCFPDFERIAR